MKYNYNEWERMRIKGKVKFIFDLENLMIIIMFILIFLVVKSVTFKHGYLLKEFLFYMIYMIISFSILLVLAQSIRWNLYTRFSEFSEENAKRKSNVIVKLNELLIGLLNLWIPLGIFYSIFMITPSSYILKNLTFTLNYVEQFTNYILINSIVWIFIGVLLELFININFLEDKKGVYIFINKKVE